MRPLAAGHQAGEADRWWRATLALAVADGAFFAVVAARPGLPAVLLWYVAPPALVLAAASLLLVALIRSWRSRAMPGQRLLAGLVVLALVIATLATFRMFPSSHDERPSHVRFRLPLDGRVTVAWGGPTPDVNYHAVMPDQRWGFDLLVTVGGRSHRGGGARLDDYHVFGRPVVAPADGVVHAARDGMPDGPIGQWRVRGVFGNHVVLQVAEGEYLFLAHLQQGSITVKPGERVRAGQPIGRVGNSGNSSEPHLHIHLQDTPVPYLGEGIPFYFYGYRHNGVTVARGMPRGGRDRWSGAFPGAFVGDVIEQAEGEEGAFPLPLLLADYQSYCALTLNSRGSRIDCGVRQAVP